MKKNSITLVMAIVLTILTGSVAYYVIQNKRDTTSISSSQKVASDLNSAKQLTLLKDSISDTATAKHTIVIENVDDPRQLQEILTLLESYSAEHEIKDLSITTNKEKVLK